MADIYLAVQSNKPGSSLVTLINGNAPPAVGYRYAGCDLGSVEWDKQYSGMRGTQGARLAGATAQNRLSTWQFEVAGTSHDDLEARLSPLFQLDEELRRYGGTLTWRPQGGSYRMYFEVLDAGVKVDQYDRLFHHNNRLRVTLGVVSPPYVKGDPMDVLDDFSTDLISADYAFDAGAAGNVAVAGGSLTAVANLTTENRLIRTVPGYPLGDHQVTLKATPGSTISGFKAGVVLKRIDASNYLEVYVDDNGTNSRLRLDKVVAGARTNLATTNLAARVANGSVFWVRGRLEGITLYAEYFTSAPTPMASPVSSTSYTLSTTEQATFATTIFGLPGFSWIPQQAAATIDDFDIQAFVYRNVAGVTLPERWPLYGTIPGDSDALAAAEITCTTGALFASFGWYRRPSPAWNRVWDGDFEVQVLASFTNGWAVSSVTNLNAGAATSIGVLAAAAKYGTQGAQLVSPATANTGGWFRMFGPFKKGVTYTAEAWVKAPSATTNTYIRLGNAAANDLASSAPVALTTTHQRISVTWTPTADYTDAYVAINIAAATATTLHLDAVMVYEGTTAPASANQSEGRGGFPPFGVIDAENGAATTIAADGTARNGFKATDGIKIPIDPTLAGAPDDYGANTVTIEVWARMSLSGPVTVTPQAFLYTAPANVPPRIYTDEYGSDGKAVTGPSAGTVWRFVRLGTLRLPIDGGRYLLDLPVGTVDYFVLLPASSRALSPTSKPPSAYPIFIQNTGGEITRRIRSDLSGRIKTPDSTAPEASAPGLGGALIELPPADLETTVKLSSLIPDDPTSSTNSESLSHPGVVHYAVTPRWRLARSS